MDFTLLTTHLLAILGAPGVQSLMEHAFYPALLGILVIASLGLPIPEDIPLIAAGVLLNLRPDIASWPGACFVALLGIMTGDLILYRMGRHLGPGVIKHRLVRPFVTPERFERAVKMFHRYGTWFCFFGRFFMGIRAVMCVTAGATRYPYWRFFLADFAGALLSVPFFIGLGYWFAYQIPLLRHYMTQIQWIMLIAAILGAVIAVKIYLVRRKKPPADVDFSHIHVSADAPAEFKAAVHQKRRRSAEEDSAGEAQVAVPVGSRRDAV